MRHELPQREPVPRLDRPHSALGYLTSAAYAANLSATRDRLCNPELGWARGPISPDWGCRSWGCLSLAEWVDGLGECDGHFVDDVAGGDAVLGLEGRKLLVSGRGIRPLIIGKVGEHEVATLGGSWPQEPSVGLGCGCSWVASFRGELFFKLGEAGDDLDRLNGLGDVADER